MEVEQAKKPNRKKFKSLRCPTCGNTEVSTLLLCYVNVTEYHHLGSAADGILSTEGMPQTETDKDSRLELLCSECGKSWSADGWEIDWG